MQGAVAVLFDRLGPYHVARITAAATAFPTIAIEFGSESSQYAWDRIEGEGSFERHTIITGGRTEDAPVHDFARKLFAVLDRTRPCAIAVPGWAHRGALLAMTWALRNQTPVIMMSASQRQDAERSPTRELIKSRVIKLCSSAVVGGQRQKEYLRDLGMLEPAIFTGYDVIDNEYFSSQAQQARADGARVRERLALPERYFLASNRFIPKKNLTILLTAYAAFRRAHGADAPKLVLLGDGPLKPELLQLRRALGLDQDVLFPGFLQYGVLPSYYGLADAFVHASTTEQWGLVVNEAMAAGLPVVVSQACGCTPDLVIEGENGFCFEPQSAEQLTQALTRLALNPQLRADMGARSSEIIAQWSPAVFAKNLGLARDFGIEAERKKAALLDNLLLLGMSLRSRWQPTGA